MAGQEPVTAAWGLKAILHRTRRWRGLHLKTGLSTWPGFRVIDIGHDTQAIPDRFDGHAVGAAGTDAPRPKSGTKKGGRPPVDRREITVNAIFIIVGGSSWELLPHDFPHYKTVRSITSPSPSAKAAVGVDPRPAPRGRPHRGRAPAPTGHRPHRQPDRQDDLAPVATAGTTGERYFSASDSSSSTSLGLIWALWVTTADQQDRDGGRWLFQLTWHRLPAVA
ncbi:MAG: transposase [Gemmataceae bacterium]